MARDSGGQDGANRGHNRAYRGQNRVYYGTLDVAMEARVQPREARMRPMDTRLGPMEAWFGLVDCGHWKPGIRWTEGRMEGPTSSYVAVEIRENLQHFKVAAATNCCSITF